MKASKQSFRKGHYFLSFHPDGRWNWAGKIIRKLGKGRREVVVFDATWLALSGELREHARRRVTVDDMATWSIHADLKSFADAVQALRQPTGGKAA